MERRCFVFNDCKFVLYEDDNVNVDKLPADIADVLVVDGPYGIIDHRCEWDKYDLSSPVGRKMFYSYYYNLFARALPRLKKTASIIIFNYPEGASIIKNVLDDNFDLFFRRWITWIYNNHFDFERGSNYYRTHEAILYYTVSDKYTFNPPAPPDTIFHPLLKADNNDFKEGAKPIEVIKQLIKVVAVPGGTVLSLFAGSGTDFLSAGEFSMNATGFEFNKRHVSLLTKQLIRNGAVMVE